MCYMKIAEDGFPMVIGLSGLVPTTTYRDGNIGAIKGKSCVLPLYFLPLCFDPKSLFSDLQGDI